MKRVNNYTRNTMQVGKIYHYIGEDSNDEEFEVMEYKMCSIPACRCGKECDGMIYYGDDDQEWCGIFADFEEANW